MKRFMLTTLLMLLGLTFAFAQEDTTLTVDQARALYSLLENIDGSASLLAEEVDVNSVANLLDDYYEQFGIDIREDSNSITVGNYFSIVIDPKRQLLRFETGVTPSLQLTDEEGALIANEWNNNYIFINVAWDETYFWISYYLPFKGGLHRDNLNDSIEWVMDLALQFQEFMEAKITEAQ